MTEIQKKQYVFSSIELPLYDMVLYRLGDYYLYVDRSLKVSSFFLEGKEYYLLGHAYSMKDSCSVYSQLSNSEIDIHEECRFWTGRWVVVSENEVFHDATGLMQVFIYDNEKENEWTISSSLAVLKQLFCLQTINTIDNNGIDWQISPSTIINGITLLGVFQRLYLDRAEIKLVEDNWYVDYKKMTTDEKCQKINNLLVTGLRNIEKYSGMNIIQALTGGKDSRLVFGALLSSGVKFSTYTAEHKNITSADVIIPQKLAKDYKVSHMFIRSSNKNKELIEDYSSFCAENTKGTDMSFFACQQFEKIPKNSIVIRSGLFEAGQSYARNRTRNAVSSFYEDMKNYYPTLVYNKTQSDAFDKWIAYVNENPIANIDIRDRFYIEQRVGTWVAAIEQSLDINDFISIQIANCAELLSVLLSATECERKELALSINTIALLDERLLNYPINKRTKRDIVRYYYSKLREPSSIVNKLLKRNR